MRVQPNHPADYMPGVLLSAIDGLRHGCGDAVIGINPAGDSVETVGTLLTARIFEVPKYQRAYAWEADEVGDFVRDISALVAFQAAVTLVPLVFAETRSPSLANPPVRRTVAPAIASLLPLLNGSPLSSVSATCVPVPPGLADDTDALLMFTGVKLSPAPDTSAPRHETSERFRRFLRCCDPMACRRLFADFGRSPNQRPNQDIQG